MSLPLLLIGWAGRTPDFSDIEAAVGQCMPEAFPKTAGTVYGPTSLHRFGQRGGVITGETKRCGNAGGGPKGLSQTVSSFTSYATPAV